jgi:hypothetical protein
MIEVLKQMVEALEWCHGGEPIGTAKAIQAGKKAIAELESQEPIGYAVSTFDFDNSIIYKVHYEHTVPLYTHPPQRTEPVALPCCGYTDASAVKWNPLNGVVQCHNCGQNYTPSQRSESSGKPSAWVGLTNDELTDLFHNTNLGQASAVAQAIELLKEKNT